MTYLTSRQLDAWPTANTSRVPAKPFFMDPAYIWVIKQHAVASHARPSSPATHKVQCNYAGEVHCIYDSPSGARQGVSEDCSQG
jgi:hypothetical protein